MQNVKMELKGKILTITVDTSKRGAKSKSGKTISIASTQGNQKVPGDESVVVGLNVYTKDGIADD